VHESLFDRFAVSYGASTCLRNCTITLSPDKGLKPLVQM